MEFLNISRIFMEIPDIKRKPMNDNAGPHLAQDNRDNASRYRIYGVIYE